MASIRRFMSASVHRLAPSDPLADAYALVEEHGVRHFPVIDGESVVGILTLSDLAVLASTMALDRDTALVSDVMTLEPYCVSSDADVGVVAREMSARRIGSALILEGDKLVGVFTSTDAVRALGELLP
ncbi:MAG: CBS domain-containing protein [Deltaproteobacteria bacterium]|nr:CBS domain-containing protein [Deltaproteobacteria bacterium]